MQHNPTRILLFLHKRLSLDRILMEMILSTFNRHRLQSHPHIDTRPGSISFWMHFTYYRNLCLNFNTLDKIAKQWLYKMAAVEELTNHSPQHSYPLHKIQGCHLKSYCLLRVAFYCQRFILPRLDLFELYKISDLHQYMNKNRGGNKDNEKDDLKESKC